MVAVQGRNFQLDDYSYAGYKLSQAGLGESIPCARVTLSAAPGSDITDKLSAAVQQLAASGGTIEIPAGSFVLSKTVWIQSDNMRIRGAGSGKTTLVISSAYNPGSYYYEAPISFNAGGDAFSPTWTQEAKSLAATLASDIRRGSPVLRVGSAKGFGVGDWAVVQQLFWEELSKKDGAGNWPTKYRDNSDWSMSFTYVRRIASIKGDLVTLDAPLPQAMQNTKHPIRFFKPDPRQFIQNVGLEGVSIQVQPNRNNQKDKGRPAGIGVNFKGAFNAWCHDVKIINAAKHAFQSCWSARVTFLDCQTQGAQDHGGGGFGYGFQTYASQAVLYKRCVASDMRHGFTHQLAMTSDVVMSQCRTLMPPGKKTQDADVDDTHVGYVQHILWDQHFQQNTGISAMHRGTRSGDLTQETFQGGAVWNYSSDGQALNWQAGKVQLSPAKYPAENDALVVGVQGASVWDNSQDNGSYVPGTQIKSATLQRGPRGNVAYEGVGQAGLEPASLFDAQLRARLGVLPRENVMSGCSEKITH